MVDRSETFVREVDEELRRDQLQQLWDKYGLYAVAAVVLLFAGVGAYKYMESRKVAAVEANGARYEAASKLIADGKPDDALKEFSAIAKDGTPGYQALGGLRVAGAHAKAGRMAEALTAFEVLGKDGRADPILRDFASLQAAMLRLDTADWTEMENRLTPLMGEKSPWRAQAREILGTAAFKAGKLDEARKAFDQLLGDRTAPQGLVQRIQQMLAILTDMEAAKAAPAVEAPKAETSPPATTPSTPPKKK